MRSAVTAIACLAALACASRAQAEQRYATPAGSGSACSQPTPCSLRTAIEGAVSNDEVVIIAGSYTLSNGVVTQLGVKNVYVHGDLGTPAPKITASMAFGSAIGVNGRLSYLDVTNGGENASAVGCGTKGIVERVRATSIGANAIGIYQDEDCLVRDSVVRADGSNATALYSGGYEGERGVARNVTAIATGTESAGIRSSTTIIAGAQSHSLDLKNTIASGTGSDLRALANAVYGVADTITVSNSNFDVVQVDTGATIDDAGGNQAAPLLFVDAANGDYREAGGSPTIDAGAIDPQIGPTDLLGGPRVVGGAPDIGAYEFVPPPETPLPPGQIQSMQVSPSAFRTVNVGGAIFSAKGKAKAPVGATVAYGLSAPATVQFRVERKVSGRKAGKRCVKKTRANKGKKKCALYKPIKGGFAHSGATGQNTFKFSGRIGGKSLKPGRFELVGGVGGSIKRAAFRIVK